MMLAIVVTSLLVILPVQGQLYVGADLHELAVLSWVQYAPQGGVMSKQDFEALQILALDTNLDECVTLAEYAAVSQQPPAIVNPIYDYYDRNSDGCWSIAEMDAIFNAMDTDGNGLVDFPEYEVYYKQLILTVFGVK